MKLLQFDAKQKRLFASVDGDYGLNFREVLELQGKLMAALTVSWNASKKHEFDQFGRELEIFLDKEVKLIKEADRRMKEKSTPEMNKQYSPSKEPAPMPISGGSGGVSSGGGFKKILWFLLILLALFIVFFFIAPFFRSVGT